MRKEWWFSCNRMTVWVVEDDGIIVATAPITQKFIAQPINNLRNWMLGLGGFKQHLLKV